VGERMKWWINLLLSIVIIVVVIPALTVQDFSLSGVEDKISPSETNGQPKDKIDIIDKSERESGRLEVVMYDHTSKKTVKMLLEEYIVGVVAAEMPASFELEALKAQAVAARTFAIRKMRTFGGSGCSNHPQADVCSLYSHCQAWISDEQQRKNWGSSYAANHEKIVRAVEETKGYIMTYDGAPIEVFFHSTSNGKTEDAGEVFSHSLPYYTVVDSPGEESSPKYKQTFTFSNDQFVKIFKSRYPRSNLSAKNLSSQIRIKSYTKSGRVGELVVGGITVKGTDFRYLYGLNSTDFRFKFEKYRVVIETRGYGHGVGMSQVGANYMAQQGHTYKEILKHYYRGVEIEKYR